MKYLLTCIFLFITSCALLNDMKSSSEVSSKSSTSSSTKKAEIQKNSSVSTEPLDKRGWEDDIRKGYIKDLGKGFYPKDIEDAFIAGRVFYDMDQGMVILIHGEPNKNVGDTLWVYMDSDKKTLLKVKFINTLVSDIHYFY